MEERVPVIVSEPRGEDLPLLEGLASRANLYYEAVVAGADEGCLGWFKERGIECYSQLGDVPRLLPGSVLLLLGEVSSSGGAYLEASARGLSLVTRETVQALAGAQTERTALSPAAVVERYHRLLDDYFPTSRSTSTQVKLVACLAEVSTLWGASGAAVFTGSGTSSTLNLLGQRGLDVPGDMQLNPPNGTALHRSYSRGKSEIVEDLEREGLGLPPGLSRGSAACVPVRSGSEILGILLTWSEAKGMFASSDLAALSLFSGYVALLLAFDDLGDRLGENLVTDPLTGLHNRRQFEHRLQQEVLRAQRYALTVSLAVFSVDNLEEYARTCGHMLGNLALSDIASVFTRGTRDVDLVARVGDDQFAAILPETNRLGALQLAYRLRSDVAAYPFPVPEGKPAIPLSLSAGIASVPSSANDYEDLLARAYQALESAKGRGPSTIKLYDEK